MEHNGLDPESNMDTGNSGAESSDNAVPNAQSESLEKQIAMWILKLKEGRKLTQSATDEILSDVTELCSTVVSNLGNDLRQRLESASINPNDIPGFDAMFNEASPYANPFKNLKTQYLQQSFYQSNFNLVVSSYTIIPSLTKSVLYSWKIHVFTNDCVSPILCNL